MLRKIPSDIATALRKLRKDRLDCTQADLAKLVGVSLSTVAKWETGQVKPSPMACMALSKHDKEKRDWWIAQAGEAYEAVDTTVQNYKRRHSYVHEDMVVVPILTSVIAAGHPAQVGTTKDEYEGSVAIQLDRASNTGSLVAARVRGSSMSPRIEDGWIVIIDTRLRLPEENIGRIIAARNHEGITIKTLKEDRGHFFLVAGNPDYEPFIQPIDSDSRWHIAGRVIKWIGEPSAPPKRK